MADAPGYRVTDQIQSRAASAAKPAQQAPFIARAFMLREQYALGYYPDPRRNDGSWREVKVELARRGLEVRTREGYVDHE